MSTQLDIPLSKIKPHPKNVRRDAVADAELLDSVREKGILQPLGVVADGSKYLLIAGHRRLDAAKRVKLKDVPVIVHDHLVDEASQIEAMLVENGRRSDLSPVEEAMAYEQLTLLGLDEKEISKRTGRSVTTVRQRLTLRKLSSAAESALHGAQISLVDAGHMIELEEHPALLSKVAESIGTDNFDLALRRAVDDANTLREHDRLRDEYRALGLPEISKPKNGWDYTRGPREVYRGDTADAWYPGIPGDPSYNGAPRLVLTKVGKATKSDDEKKLEVEHAARQAKMREEQKAAQLARQLRIEHVVAMAPTLKIPKPLMPHVRLAAGELIAGQQAPEIELIIAATGLPLERVKNDYSNRELAAQVHGLTDAQAIVVFLAAAAAQSTTATSTGYGSGLTEATCTNVTAYWEAFDTSGYALPDVDKTDRDHQLDRVARARKDEDVA